jgi:hypothetical protein
MKQNFQLHYFYGENENEINFPIKWALEIIKFNNPDFSRIIVFIYK